MILNDIEIVDFKKSLKKKYGLSSLLKEIGNPEKNIEVINVVGTNGKGTVSNALSQILQMKYERVGLFTSPSFLFHNERFMINNDYITDDELYGIIGKYKYYIDLYELTFFEIFTLVAIIYFNNHNIDIAVIEAGIGGTLDSTSVFKKQRLVVVTSISFDHQEILGKRIHQIIDQKIGIAGEGIPIYISSDNLPHKKYIIKKYHNITFTKPFEKTLFYNRGNYGLIKTIAEHFSINFDINNIKRPLGRFTFLQEIPVFLIDGCHNIDGIKKSIKSLPKKDFVFLFASSKNENFWFIKYIKKINPKTFFCEFEHFKSWKLTNKQKSKKGYVSNWKKFLVENKDNNLFIFGSLYFIPEIYKYYKNNFK